MVVIRVTRFDGTEFVVNSDLIEMLEAVPDTVITLTTGKKLVVQEDVDEVTRRVRNYRRELLRGWADGVRTED